MEEQENEKSSIEHPLQFFNFFLKENGYIKFCDSFYSIQDNQGNLYANQIINRDEEYVDLSPDSFLYLMDNEWDPNEDHRVYFKDALKSTLTQQYEISKGFVSKKIESFDYNKEKINYFFEFIFNELILLINLVKLSEYYVKYPIILENLFGLVVFLFNLPGANLHLNSDYPVYNESKEFFKSKDVELLEKKSDERSQKFTDIKEKTEKVVKALSWRNYPELNTLTLFKILSENYIIPEDGGTLENFNHAISGNKLNTSLKIKWSLTKNNSIKPPLVRIFKYLLIEELGLISPMENSELADALEMIFVNNDGIPAQNTIQSLLGPISKKSNNPIEIDLHKQIREAKFVK